MDKRYDWKILTSQCNSATISLQEQKVMAVRAQIIKEKDVYYGPLKEN
jgi:hypothetical protein